ncbi:hypothetical protein DFH07DRAFT_69600 [Mycena maculata]|uniref:BTB domain-containing protein n=1 Tax=Mycena maculata TaxID=230809 RepID=A0AAD7ICY0_9AGAR|nr:hypothetical protein DFH07DRAFT_69600 [Mycena maculata]
MRMNISDASTDGNGPAGATPVRDEKYFLDDGDCMFLVEGIFFKVHKSFLGRDPESMFCGMFSIPQVITSRQPTDLEPIQLAGDTADEFRALCWAIYALPNEIHLQSTSSADIPRLVNVAKMCHKYTLHVFETWALDMIAAQGQDYLSICPADILPRLMSLAAQCNHIQLLALVETNWMTRIRAGLPCNEALSAGEINGRRQFLVEVYHHLHKELCVSTLSPGSRFSHLHLTPQQLFRLLSGHTLLSNFWNHLCRDPVPQGNACFGHTRCRDSWALIPRDPADITDITVALRGVQTAVSAVNWDIHCTPQYLNQVVDGFNLEDYFFPAEGI